MGMRTFFGKQTWIGFSVATGAMILFLLLGALLFVRGIIPIHMAPLWLQGSYGLSAFAGGRIAAAGKSRRLCAIAPGTLLYAAAWLAALCSECTLDFAQHGLGITVAVAIGVILAYVGSGRKKKKHRHDKSVKKHFNRGKRR